MNLAIIVLIVLFSVSSFFFARTKVKKIAISNQTKLNALPDYYGYYLSLWCALPALLILVVWTIFEPSIIKAFIFQGISGENAQTYNNSELNFSEKSVLVFGSEGKGIRDLVKKECDEIIKLKMRQHKHYQIDSLNVSNAATIALYEFFKS